MFIIFSNFTFKFKIQTYVKHIKKRLMPFLFLLNYLIMFNKPITPLPVSGFGFGFVGSNLSIPIQSGK